MPPSFAIIIAIVAPVTVSTLEEINGRVSEIFLVNLVLRSTSDLDLIDDF